MSDKDIKKYSGNQTHQGDDHSAPYPVSRMSPAIELVDLAKQVAQADSALNLRVTSKLRVIADQIKVLQSEAKHILEEATQEQTLNQAVCQFKRIPGKIYHLYKKQDNSLYFSMLSPKDWGDKPPHAFIGSYRLENDFSWTPEEKLNMQDDTRETIQMLLGEFKP